jgi:hypothetical protein
MNYVYLHSEKAGYDPETGASWGNLWTVGHYATDENGKDIWHPESDHEKEEAAAERVAFLNGAGTSSDAEVIEAACKETAKNVSEEIKSRLPDHLQHWTDVEWQEVSPEILK